jgi:gliding motility-associated-like protein
MQLQALTDTIITSYQWAPSAGLNNIAIADPVASPSADTRYEVTVTAADGCTAKAFIDILVYHALQMPNAFTPNGDGHNDVFRVPPMLQITVINFSVYDRWGQRVFSTTNSSEGWDGRINNQPQPAGAYVWKIEYVDSLTGRPAMASGTVILVR